MHQYGLAPFRPELSVIIGCNTDFQTIEDRRENEKELRSLGLKLYTYDDLISYAKARVVPIGQS